MDDGPWLAPAFYFLIDFQTRLSDNGTDRTFSGYSYPPLRPLWTA